MARGARRLAAVMLLLGSPAATQAQARTPVKTTRHFVFYNDLATNLYDALMTAGVARRDKKPEPYLSHRQLSHC